MPGNAASEQEGTKQRFPTTLEVAQHLGSTVADGTTHDVLHLFNNRTRSHYNIPSLDMLVLIHHRKGLPSVFLLVPCTRNPWLRERERESER
mmetsp:Transcript_5325/g.12125  ORF Transcript_5325/g.12125 Transcript_5325/m.12125 type:complete len:92 (+) Transcript_5325:2283-2558(+)